MTQIKKEDGKKIIDFLESTLKVQIPRDGFLAGQSVCSALLYLHKKHKEFFVNDLDIFLSSGTLSRREVRGFNLKQSNMLHSMVGFNNTKHFSSTFKFSDSNISSNLDINKELQKELQKKENQNVLSKGEYNKCFVSGLARSIKNKHTFYDKKEVTFKAFSSRGIFDTTRKGIFNYIYFENNYYNSNDYLKILTDFDINCTQIGICLRTHRLIFTNEFLNFYNTMQLTICKPDTPYHSIIRLFKKQHEFNFDCSLEFESFYIANLLRFGFFSKINKYKDRNYKFSGYCFGDIYADKYKTNNEINKYFNLYELKKQGQEIKDRRKEAKDKFYDYNLYKLRSSIDSFNYIESGEHKKKLEDNLGADIKGYEDYVHIHLRNIMKSNIESNKKSYSYSTQDVDFANKYKNINKENNYNSINSREREYNLEYEIFNYYQSKGSAINEDFIKGIVDIYYKSTYFKKFLYLTDNLEDMYKIFKYINEQYNKDNIVKGAIIHKKFKKENYNYKDLLGSITRTINNKKSKYSQELLNSKKYIFKCPSKYNYEVLNTEYKLKEQSLYQKFVLTPYKYGVKNDLYVIVSFYTDVNNRMTLILNINDGEFYLNSYKIYTYNKGNITEQKHSEQILNEILELNNIKKY